MERIKVSIIMPVYNAERYLIEAIESLLGQTFRDFELLVVNDVSEDGTEAIVRRYAAKDTRIRLLQNSKGKGVAGGINTGLENARGEYIARADGDDINRPNRLEKQVEYLDRNPDIYLVGGGYAPFNENGHRIDAFHPVSPYEIAWHFVTNTFFCHPSVMFRRTVYEACGPYPAVDAEDFAYFSLVVKRFPCTNLQMILLDYRESLTNRSHEAKERIVASVRTQARSNYVLRLGKDDGFDLFFRYQNGGILRYSDFLAVEAINYRLLKSIFSDYGKSIFSSEFFLLSFRILLQDTYRILFR